MKKLFLILAILAIAVSPSLAREVVQVEGISMPGTRTADIELEYDGGFFVSYGTSPNWTDTEVVTFEGPAGGPWVVAEVRFYMFGMTQRPVRFYTPAGLFSPPGNTFDSGPNFATAYSAWPPADWTTVAIGNRNLAAGQLTATGCQIFSTDGIGLAGAYDDGNPGHSWAIYGGSWTDDTYDYGYDAGIRLGLNDAGGTPIQETTWGALKSMF